jgi:hypothetical protein
VTVLTETEKEMVSVERACEYIEEVESERQTEGGDRDPTLLYLWPAQGVIEFTCVSLRYRLKRLRYHHFCNPVVA